MHIRETPDRLLIFHRPRFAAVVALILWSSAVLGGVLLTVVWPGGPAIATLAWVILLALAGLAVLLTETRAVTWIFDRRTAELRLLRRGWVGALRAQPATPLCEIESVLRTDAAGDLRSCEPHLRLTDGTLEPLFPLDCRASRRNRQRAWEAAHRFLRGVSPEAAPAPAVHGLRSFQV